MINRLELVRSQIYSTSRASSLTRTIKKAGDELDRKLDRSRDEPDRAAR